MKNKNNYFYVLYSITGDHSFLELFIMPTVSPLPVRRSTRKSNPPERLREDEPLVGLTDDPQLDLGVTPRVASVVEAAVLQHDLMADSPEASTNQRNSEVESEDDSLSSRDSSVARHPSDNYNRKVRLERLYFVLFLLCFCYLTHVAVHAKRSSTYDGVTYLSSLETSKVIYCKNREGRKICNGQLHP